jgi:hypothetical protein
MPRSDPSKKSKHVFPEGTRAYSLGEALTPKPYSLGEALGSKSVFPRGSTSKISTHGKNRGSGVTSPMLPEPTEQDGSPGYADLVEAYFAHWLQKTDVGRNSVATLGFNGAMDALFETLNAGLIKLETNERGFTGIRPIAPAQPPLVKIFRSGGAA